MIKRKIRHFKSMNRKKKIELIYQKSQKFARSRSIAAFTFPSVAVSAEKKEKGKRK